MTEHVPDRVWSGIDIPKTLAGALAAVCAAVIGSFLGVAGTLIGAAVASIIGSVGTEIWKNSIRKGTHHIQTTIAPAFITAPAAVGTPQVAAATEEDSPSHTVPEGERPAKRLRWGRISAVAAVLFVVAIGSLTVVELFAKESVASMVGGSSAGSTTLSSVTGDGNSKKDTPAPAVSSTPAPTGTGDNPGTTKPADAPSGAPASAAPTTGAPATDAPTQAPETKSTGGSDGGDTGDAGGGEGGAVQEQTTSGGGDVAQQ